MLKYPRILVAAGLVAGAALTMPNTSVVAQSNSWNALYDRIIRLEHEVRAMKGSGGGTAAQGDISYRLQAIEEQIRRLAGSVNAVRDQMTVMQRRIKRLEERRSGRATQQQYAVAEPSQPTVTYSEQVSEPVSDELDLSVLPENSQPSTSGVVNGTQYQTQFEPAPGPQVLGQLVIRNDGGLPGSGLGEGSTLLPGKVESAALDSPTGLAGATPDDLYEQSYKNLLGRRFGLAEAGFKTFLMQNPKHSLSSKAHYWLGETYYVQRRFKQAAQSFLTGYRTFPKGARAAESLLKLGMSLNRLGQKKQACGAFAEVRRSYPRAKAVRDQAAREKKRAGC